MNTLDQNKLIALATEYRQANPDNLPIDCSTGFVLVYGNGVCGWGLEPSPSSWKPGTIAIDLTGKMKVAVGGNDYDGAQAWGMLAQPEQPETDSPTPEADAESEAKALVYLPEFAKHTANHHSEQIDGPVVVMGCEALENLLRLIALEATTGNLHQYSRYLARDLHTQIDRHVLEFRDLL